MQIVTVSLHDLQVMLDQSAERIISAVAMQSSQFANPQNQWFNISELCQYLPDKPARATIYGKVSAAAIPCHKDGKKLRFLKSEIDTWLLQGRKKTTSEMEAETDQYLTARLISRRAAK